MKYAKFALLPIILMLGLFGIFGCSPSYDEQILLLSAQIESLREQLKDARTDYDSLRYEYIELNERLLKLESEGGNSKRYYSVGETIEYFSGDEKLLDITCNFLDENRTKLFNQFIFYPDTNLTAKNIVTLLDLRYYYFENSTLKFLPFGENVRLPLQSIFLHIYSGNIYIAALQIRE